MKFFKTFICVVILLYCSSIKGQDILLKPTSLIYPELSEEIPEYICPTFDVEKMKAEDEINEELGEGALRFAKGFDVSLDLSNYGRWEEINDLKVWRLSIKSQDAYAMMLVLQDINLTDNSSIFIYNPDKSHKHGPYTKVYSENQKVLPLPLIKGDNIIIELVHKSTDDEVPSFKIKTIGHDYRNFLNNFNEDLYSDFGGSILECHNDVRCHSNWETQKQSVARIIFPIVPDQPIDETNFSACSGALINNTNVVSNVPFFLTAAHCIDTREIANEAIFYFNYEKETCNGSGDGEIEHIVIGSELRWTEIDVDMTLLELDSRIPSSYKPYFTGWDRRDQIPETATVIHHPRAHVKKISFDMDQPVVNDDDLVVNTGFNTSRTLPSEHAWIVQFDDGTTEGGSSGAPLFNQNQRLIGTNSANGSREDDLCDNIKWYGRFNKGWDLGLDNFLDLAGNSPSEIEGHLAGGWRHTLIGDPNASNSDKVDKKIKSITVGAGNQIFYRGNNNHVQTFVFSPSSNTFQHENIGSGLSQKIKGDIVVGHGNQLFYRGNDGHMHTFFWHNNQWNHAKLSDFISNSSNNHKVSDKEGSITINVVTNQLFYRGNDDKVQTYFWTPANNWQHDYLNVSAPSNHEVDGDIEFDPNTSNDERVVYRGVDGKIHFYTFTGGSWLHGYMSATHQVSEEPGSIVVGETGQIFFRGTDNKMQTFYTNNGVWTHDWLGGWNGSNSQDITGDIVISPGNSLFYRGVDGKMHTWQWNGKWVHDWLETSWQAPFIHSVNGSIAIGTSTGSSHLFYRGTDDRMKRYHWEAKEVKSFNLSSGYYSMQETELSTTIPNLNYKNNLLDLVVNPNPVQNNLTINLHAQSDSDGQLFIYDGVGRLVVEQSIKISSGLNNFDLELTNLDSGIYYLSIIDTNGGRISEKIIKM